MTQDTKAKVPRSGDASAMKEYTAPRLVIYGDISRITRAVDNSGKLDVPKAGGAMDKS